MLYLHLPFLMIYFYLFVYLYFCPLPFFLFCDFSFRFTCIHTQGLAFTSRRSSEVLEAGSQLWLRGRANILLLEGRWFDSLGLHIKVSLGKILNPKLLLMFWLAICTAATAISVLIYELLSSLWTKMPTKCQCKSKSRNKVFSHLEGGRLGKSSFLSKKKKKKHYTRETKEKYEY